MENSSLYEENLVVTLWTAPVSSIFKWPLSLKSKGCWLQVWQIKVDLKRHSRRTDAKTKVSLAFFQLMEHSHNNLSLNKFGLSSAEASTYR